MSSTFNSCLGSIINSIQVNSNVRLDYNRSSNSRITNYRSNHQPIPQSPMNSNRTVTSNGQLRLKRSEIKLIEDRIDELSDRLREFSLKMFEFPELAMKEFKTHDLLASFMEEQTGWTVNRHAYGIETAVEAIFKSGEGGRTVGFNSEMDALPGIGHACGHPLICISGIAAALATATALEKTSTPGTVILLGTPAEETIGGKIMLLEKGAYRKMDACLMLHPAPYGGLLDMLAITQIKVEYFGKTAHAAGAPWEAINALDAAVSAYNNISVLRQQIHPTQRVHGIIQGSEKWVQNVIPDYAYLTYDIRAKTKSEMLDLKERVLNCFKASSLSSGCKIEITEEMVYDDLINNELLGKEYKRYMEDQRGIEVPLEGPILGSTDFGNVSYEVPSIHPLFKIPCEEGQGNHTKGFTRASAKLRAHQLSLESAKGIAIVGFRVLKDEGFSKAVYKSFLKSSK
ncbi:hypothetical protein BY996DRAFT_7248504 [Phakopsora pachyrhizi]|nr:hypothetical protein BY996DRAFT_7248504 [Phakopsora pachyrhizi]